MEGDASELRPVSIRSLIIGAAAVNTLFLMTFVLNVFAALPILMWMGGFKFLEQTSQAVHGFEIIFSILFLVAFNICQYSVWCSRGFSDFIPFRMFGAAVGYVAYAVWSIGNGHFDGYAVCVASAVVLMAVVIEARERKKARQLVDGNDN